MVNKKLTFLEMIDQAKLISDSSGNSKLCVEDVGYQSSAVETLTKDGYKAVGVKIHGQDKYARLSAVSHLVQSGKVFFPRLAAKTLENQLSGLGAEKHDDLVDAFSILALQIVKRAGKQGRRASAFHLHIWVLQGRYF